MLEIVRASLNCFYKDSNSRICWRSDLKNSDIFHLFQLMKIRNNNKIDSFDKDNIVELLNTIEGPLNRRTIIRKFDHFKIQCKQKSKNVFLNLPFEGICAKINFYQNRYKNPEFVVKLRENQITRLKNQLKYSESANILKSDKGSSELQKRDIVIYKMLEMPISYTKIVEIMGLFKRNTSLATIFRLKEKFIYLVELATAKMLDGLLKNGNNFTLHHDETTMGVHKLQAFVLTAVMDNEFHEILIAIEKVPTKGTQYQLEVLLKCLDRMDDILNAKGNLKKQFLLKLEACLADSAATSSAFNKLLHKERLKIGNENEFLVLKDLNLKDCFVHAANNVSKDTIEVFNQNDNQFVVKIKYIAKTMNLKNAAFHPISADFRNFQTEKGISHPKSVGDLAGHRFMFISDLAWQILKLKDVLLEFTNKYPEAYNEAKIIREYLTDNDFLQQLKMCVLIHATCIEPLKHVSSSEAIVASDHHDFKEMLTEIFSYMESGYISQTEFLNLVPPKFYFAFNKDKLDLISMNMENQIFQSALVAAKESMLKRYIDRPIDDVYSFHSNINVERVFAMVKRNEDMAPHKEIYTRCQQVKARHNKCMHYIFDLQHFDQTKDEVEKGTTLMRKHIHENARWNARERMIRLENIERNQQIKKRRSDSKILFQNIDQIDEPIELCDLLTQLSDIELQSHRIKILKKQINILRSKHYKYHGEKIWQTKTIDLEAELKEKLKNLHSYTEF